MRERALTEITKKISKNSEKIPICPKWQHWSDEREGVNRSYKKISKNSEKFQFVRNGNIGPMRERVLTKITEKIQKNSEKNSNLSEMATLVR